MKAAAAGQRILFVRHAALGDVLFTTPFLRLLREDRPGTVVDLFSLREGGLEGVRGFGRWRSMQDEDPRRVLGDYGASVFWFSYEHDPTLHILDGYELATGLKLRDRTLSWTVDPAGAAQAKRRLDGLPRPVVGFSPASAHALRSLPAGRIQEFVDRIAGACGGTVVVTSDQRLALTGCLNLTKQFRSLRELGALIAACDAWVTVDTAPLHIAQALGVPVVGLFGCTLPELRVTRPGQARLVRDESLDCLGCYHHLDPHAETLPACRRGDLACMNLLDAGAVAEAVGEALAGRPDPRLLARVQAYEFDRAARLEALPAGYGAAVAERYQARILGYRRQTGLLKRLERRLRKHRKQLVAWLLERG